MYNQDIGTDSVVIIKDGKYKDIRDTVKHVYKMLVFLFCSDFNTE